MPIGPPTCKECIYFIGREDCEKLTTNPESPLYWRVLSADNTSEIGRCTRFPPIMNPEKQVYRFPVVCDLIYCGEFKERSVPETIDNKFESIGE